MKQGTEPAESSSSEAAEPPQPPSEFNRWERYELPADMTGRRFLDVGCWEGVMCAEAVSRGAEQVVGIDLCTSDKLRDNVERFGFEFVQMDVLSEKWLELDTFDVVLCSGVLYHVENVISLLLRLRKVTDELLVLETKVKSIAEDEPVLVLRPDDEVNNPSNWWVPNRRAVVEMLRTCGFTDVTTVLDVEGRNRLCVHARPTRRSDYERALPRKREAMSLYGGERWHKLRKKLRADEREQAPAVDD